MPAALWFRSRGVRGDAGAYPFADRKTGGGRGFHGWMFLAGRERKVSPLAVPFGFAQGAASGEMTGCLE